MGAFVRKLVVAALVVAAIPFTLVILCQPLGYQPLIVRGGSMGESIPAGSLAAAKWIRSGQVTQDDVIMISKGDVPYVHRVKEIRAHRQGIEVVTQGDANERIDPEPWLLPSKVLRISWSLPYIGYFANFASNKVVMILLLVVFPALALFSFAFSGTESTQRREARTT